MFYGSTEIEKNRDSLRTVYSEMRTKFDDTKTCLFLVSINPSDRTTGVRDSLPGIRVVRDYELKISKLYGAVSPEAKPLGQGNVNFWSFSLVLDFRLRVHKFIPMDSAEQHSKDLSESIDACLSEETNSREWINAPVLIVPNVFPRTFCDQLIEYYRAIGGSVSGTMSSREGQTVEVVNPDFKRRLDCSIDDANLIHTYNKHIRQNLIPQIHRAFNFYPTHVERYVVACYDSKDKGFFKAHRDNTTKGTAHRIFACTINLNAEEYTGGDLRFLEYSDKTYRAPSGGAVVFSGAMLHEVLPVTSGQRYATLPFMHDDAAEKIRLENAKTISEEIIYVKSKSKVSEE
jgi:predicted 2-oxoglutarate/Fe(II)-dependent dioxygenase YbiX